MKTRTDLYGQEATSLLRDIAMYRVLTKEQLLRLYPGKRNVIETLLSRLVWQCRIFEENGLFFATPECAENIDRSLMAAIWVLTDFIDRVEYHAVGDYPAKLIFFADGTVYEVIHAAQGKETLLAHVMSGKSNETSRYLVLVDDIEQIEELHLPNVSGYCTVSDTGEVTYYQKE